MTELLKGKVRLRLALLMPNGLLSMRSLQLKLSGSITQMQSVGPRIAM